MGSFHDKAVYLYGAIMGILETTYECNLKTIQHHNLYTSWQIMKEN